MIVEYVGGMKFVARQRGVEAVSDQPESGGGENTALTPTELFIAALPMCVGVYVVPFARRHGIPVDGMQIETEYEIANHPRRVGRIDVRIKMPASVDERQRAALQRCAEQCLVHNTLHHPPEVSIELA